MRSLVIGLFLVLAASLRGAEIRFNFSGLAAGSAPTNFLAVLAGNGQPGDWKIVMDDVPPLLAPLTDQAPSVKPVELLRRPHQRPG
jgi:hypothetical protein